MKRRGVTLLEILLAVLLLGIVSSTVWQLFHFGTRSSREGIRRAERTLEGQRIMKQIRLDLEHACSLTATFATDLGNPQWLEGTMGPNDSTALLSFTFHSFPAKGSLSSAIGPDQATGSLEIPLDRIAYSLEKGSNPSSPLYKLVRRTWPGIGNAAGVTNQELSSHVIVFLIRPVRVVDTAGCAQWVFNILLALADPLAPGKEANARLTEMIVTEFYDVVCPVAFAARWNDPHLVPNWYLKPTASPAN